jgi:hypothetical protein
MVYFTPFLISPKGEKIIANAFPRGYPLYTFILLSWKGYIIKIIITYSGFSVGLLPENN